MTQEAIIDFDGFANNPRIDGLLEEAEKIAINNYIYESNLFSHLLEVDEQELHEYVIERVSFSYPKKDIEKYYGKIVIDFLNDLMGTNLKFISVNKCKDYMISNDSLNITFNDEDFEKIKTFIDKHDLNASLQTELENTTTSHPGYIPFYTKEEVKQNPNLLIRVIINTIWDHVGFEDHINSFNSYWDKHCCLHAVDFVATINDVLELKDALSVFNREHVE